MITPARVEAIVMPILLGMFGLFLVGGLGLQQARDENRTLEHFPSASVESVTNGTFMLGVESYVGDHFPWRMNLLGAGDWIRARGGLRLSDEVFYAADALDGLNDTSNWVGSAARLDEAADGDENSTDKDLEEAPGEEGEVPVDGPQPSHPETAPAPAAGSEDLADSSKRAEKKSDKGKTARLRIARGILIYKDRAMQVFGGSLRRAKQYAELINDLRTRVAPEINVYSVVVPTAISFMLPEGHPRSGKERPFLDAIGLALSPTVRHVDAFTSLQAHRDEPLYFKSDHHWTGRGAYYTYRAFCERAGLVAPSLEDMERRVKHRFQGSMFRYTRDEVIKTVREDVEYWLPPVNYTATRRPFKRQKKVVETEFLQEKSKGYGVFLGADWPLMEAETDVGNGRRVLIIKNSYGNPLCVFLLSSFERVVVVDYRYYEGRLDTLVEKHKITDVLVMNVTLTAASRNHQRQVERLFETIELPSADSAGSSPTPSVPENPVQKPADAGVAPPVPKSDGSSQ